ncbi:MAG: hypothetical protein GXP45_00585 [bacterium]|nr:hypothetical protein [bacterium]
MKTKKFFLVVFLMGLFVPNFAQIKTYLEKTDQQFQNHEYVWSVYLTENGQNRLVGEWWPVHAINLITKGTDPQVFQNEMDLDVLVDSLEAVATAPDGMSTAFRGSHIMEGKALANGVPCGDGKVYNYGIVVVKNGYDIQFTHNLEIPDYDVFYQEKKDEGATVFFLPSIYRKGKYLNSSARLDKVLVRRKTSVGIQIGIMVFYGLVTYNQAREIVLAWDRPPYSQTTHIYMLDGGDTWGQAAKEVNDAVTLVGMRNPAKVTNYLIFY